MTGRRLLAAALALLLVGGACGDARPSGDAGSPTPGAADDASPTPVTTERPFERAAWPAGGSACDVEGYDGLLGRVEALGARSVRFTLCRPDGAFPARLAHPALGVLDASLVAAVEADPVAARGAAGAGEFRIEDWSDEDAAIRLVRTVPGEGPTDRVVLRWAEASSARADALREGTVDAVDDLAPADAADLETLPEAVVRPRAGLGTAYLGFGAGRVFNTLAVRRAFAQGLDHEALARDAFPPGSVAATHLAPCEVLGGCAGLPWYEFNGPAGAAGLALAGFDAARTTPLRVPDRPVPGLPDPAAAGAAVAAGLGDSLGVVIAVRTVPADTLAAAIAAGEVSGLYLWGVTSTLADASGFLAPLVAERADGTVAARAKGARGALDDAAATLEPAARVDAFARANDALRGSAALVPLVHPGSATAWLGDVEGAAVSPLGVDPLGDARAGDRRQLVAMSAAAPGAAWCAVAPDPASLRLCGLATPGLYAFGGGGLDPRPALARSCTPSADARRWTCRLVEGVRFSNGMRLDAGDVLASVRAQADAGGGLRAGLPAEAFAAWDALFGGPVPRVP